MLGDVFNSEAENSQRWQLSRYPSPNVKVIAKSDNTSQEWGGGGGYVKEIIDAACSHIPLVGKKAKSIQTWCGNDLGVDINLSDLVDLKSWDSGKNRQSCGSK